MMYENAQYPYAVMAVDCEGMGGGELAAGVETIIGSGWSPTLLSIAVSLSVGFMSLLLCCEISFTSLESSPFSNIGVSPPFQEGISHMTPVKLFN